MLGWFRAMMPKEDRFFDLFERHSKTLVAGADALRKLLEGGEAVPQYCRVIVDREHDADDIAREVLLAVRRTFITPFDRGDIKDLIQSMDDAIDQMHQTAKTITLFQLRSFEPPMREMGEIIVEAANLTAEAVPLLRSIGTNAAALNAYAEKVTELEGRADDLHDEGLRTLYHAHRSGDAMGYIVGSEVYGRLERVVDRFEDVANEINSIVIEHV
jgi:predicted phosphate transport protein (TIGR00153 family)